MNRICLLLCPVLLLAAVHTADGQPAAGPVIADMDTLRFKPPKDKGDVSLVDGKFGKAVRFQFPKDARSSFCTSNLRATPEWDRADGFSFWVYGNGGDQFAGLQFIYDNDYAVRYDLAFPVKGGEWTRISVAWRDLIPVLPGAKNVPLGKTAANVPSKLSALWIGRWWYWGDYPALDFTIDDIRLEPAIPEETASYRPDGAPLRRVFAKLLAGQPITIVTMGDSLTDYRHWANRKISWPNLLKEQIKAKYGSDVSIINPAIGGTQLRQNLILMPRWLESTPAPDLVTICFGGNDWDAGMRGEQFTQACNDAVQRVRRATKGQADVLLLTTVPGAERWQTMAELAEACRTAAKQQNAGLADTEARFHAAGKDERNRLYVFDKVHLSPVGHELLASEVLNALQRK